MNTKTKATLAAILIALTGATAGACGGDDESTTSTTSTGATGATGSTGSTGAGSSTDDSGSVSPSGGGELDAAVTKLEDAGYEVEDAPAGDFTETVGLPKPVDAVAGVYASEPSGPAQLGVAEYATPEDAEAAAKSEDMNFTEGEVVNGTIVVSLTDDTRDEIAAAVKVIEG